VSWHVLRFSRTGAARYLSHLDTSRALQRSFARAGIAIALSRGMRPKPHLSLVLPLPVGATGLHELAVVELVMPEVEDSPGAVAANGVGTLRRLRAAAPKGIGIDALEDAAARPRLDPVSADYECEVAADPERLASAVAWFAAQTSVAWQRTSPKGTRDIDLKRYVCGPAVGSSPNGARLSFTVRYRRDGAARPEEFVRLLALRAEADPVMRDLVRTRITVKERSGLRGRAEKE
jgi:radical SAM-linked protein